MSPQGWTTSRPRASSSATTPSDRRQLRVIEGGASAPAAPRATPTFCELAALDTTNRLSVAKALRHLSWAPGPLSAGGAAGVVWLSTLRTGALVGDATLDAAGRIRLGGALVAALGVRPSEQVLVMAFPASRRVAIVAAATAIEALVASRLVDATPSGLGR